MKVCEKDTEILKAHLWKANSFIFRMFPQGTIDKQIYSKVNNFNFSQDDMFPDFIIIGAMKCGTSSLYHYLSIHPEVEMSEIKELDYFVAENNFDKGEEWYSAQFTREGKIHGEASPNYSKAHFFKKVPERMHALVPDVKLIYLVRDPVERIISHYTHNYGEGRENRSLHEVLANLEDNHYVACSRYYWQLEHYLEFYDADQILVVPTNELRNQRRVTLQCIFDFIGVDASFYDPAYDSVKHQTNQKLKKSHLSWYILSSPGIKTLKGLIPDAVKDPIKRMTRSKVEKPEMDPKDEQRVRDFLQADIAALERFANRKLAFSPQGTSPENL